MKWTSKTLETISNGFKELNDKCGRKIVICGGTGCVANGSLEVFDSFIEKIREEDLDAVTELKVEKLDKSVSGERRVRLSASGCQGFCQMGPLVSIEPDGILYCRVKPEDVEEIVRKTICDGKVVDRLLFRDPSTGKHCRGTGDIPFYTAQHRMVLRECGHLDPGNIDEYISHGGYKSAFDACRNFSSSTICEEITASGLRGRGGGGFPTGRKMKLTLDQPGDAKFVICNGDEGDPGAFMDRSVMEGNPHSIIEGMLIVARGIGANAGYVYVRAEYPLAVERVRNAVEAARKLNILGKGIFGTQYNFDLTVMEGAGAFVCGEETALMASIEGRRGMPNPKPPYPAQCGLQGKPTIINNVETLASIPLILRYGAKKFRSFGTEGSPGTKTFALTGHVANTGLIEVPFGITLREIIFKIGGGITDDQGNPMPGGFKAAQIGGPSGGCLTMDHMDIPIDFDSLTSLGAMVGSGGLVVLNKKTCMVKIARFFMQFTQNESCGKCVLCREGTKQMLVLLDDIINGEADENTLDTLEELASAVAKGSLCGLGKTAPNPVLSTMKYFRAEYEAHVFQKRCPAGQCKKLAKPHIDPELCRGCGLCASKCPVGAISGERGKPWTIDQGSCINCGACIETCKFGAVVGG